MLIISNILRCVNVHSYHKQPRIGQQFVFSSKLGDHWHPGLLVSEFGLLLVQSAHALTRQRCHLDPSINSYERSYIEFLVEEIGPSQFFQNELETQISFGVTALEQPDRPFWNLDSWSSMCYDESSYMFYCNKMTTCPGNQRINSVKRVSKGDRVGLLVDQRR